MRKEYRAICMPRRLRRGRLKTTPFHKTEDQTLVHLARNDNCPLQSVVAKRRPGVPLDMSRIAPEYLDREPSDYPTAADVLFWREPDDEERTGR